MDVLRVPQNEVHVRVRLLDQRDLTGVMYVDPIGPTGGRGHLTDRLNLGSEDFLPLTVDGRTQLIHRGQILVVEIDGDSAAADESPVEESRLSRHLEIEVRLASGFEVRGRLSYLQPTDHERLLDYLNVERRFLPLRVDDRRVYVNRDQIVGVRPLDGE